MIPDVVSGEPDDRRVITLISLRGCELKRVFSGVDPLQCAFYGTANREWDANCNKESQVGIYRYFIRGDSSSNRTWLLRKLLSRIKFYLEDKFRIWRRRMQTTILQFLSPTRSNDSTYHHKCLNVRIEFSQDSYRFYKVFYESLYSLSRCQFRGWEWLRVEDTWW